MSKKTFKQLRDFDEMVAKMYKENTNLERSKFGHAVRRFNEKNYIPHLKEYRDEVQNAWIDFALTDEKTKAVILDDKSQRGYAYSKEGLKQVMEAENNIVNKWNVKEFEVEPFICSDLPDDLTDEQKELFTGIIM